MSETDHNLRERLRLESDDILFEGMEMSEGVKERIRQQASAKTAARRFVYPKSWKLGAAGLAVAILLIIGLPMILSPAGSDPSENQATGSLPSSNAGTSGSELSSLITTSLSSVEDAKEAFGTGLLVPNEVPEGFAISDIVAAGMKGEPARDVVFTYDSGDLTFTYVVSRMPAAFPEDLFKPTKVGDADGFVFEQPELIELYWTKEGIQYSIVGQLSADEAMKAAESV